MNKSRFRGLIGLVASKLVSLTATKGEEYARDEDQLANFKRQGQDHKLPPEAILLVYLNKHMDSIKNLVFNLRDTPLYNIKESEPIEGRIDDAILYLVLLRGLIMERRNTDKDLDDVPAGKLLSWCQVPKSLDDAYDDAPAGFGFVNPVKINPHLGN